MNDISLHPASRVRRRSSRKNGFSIAAAARACRTYFDWHPVIGGFALMAASAVAAAAASASFLFAAAIPSTGGWPICTPLNGAVLAILLMSRRKLWPFLLLGYVLAVSRGPVLTGAAHHPGAVEISGNLVELLLAAFALPPYRNLKQWLQEPRLPRAFAGYALLLGPALMALVAARGTGTLPDLLVGYWERVRVIGFSESLGVALGASLVLVVCNRQTYRLFRWRALPRTVGLLSLLGITTWFAFTSATAPATASASGQTASAIVSGSILLPCAVLVLIAFQLGIRGAVLATAAASAIVCAMTVSGHAAGAATTSQSFITFAVLAMLPLGVALARGTYLESRVAEYQAELDKLRSLDRLTGIANRKRFDLVLTREWQRATRDPKPIALLMIDTDFFDLYNEHYGSQAGDECLRLIAVKMSEQPHRQQDLLSRFDGGRFSVLLPGASGDAVKRIGEEFRAEIAALDLLHERSQFGRVTVSVGWASMMPESDLKPELLISAAEAALTSAKKKGRNRVEGFARNVVEMTAAR